MIHLYVKSKKKKKNKKKTVNITKIKQAQRYRKQTSGYQWGQRRERANIGVGN